MARHLARRKTANGDYLMALADAAGNALGPSIVVDNKDKAAVTEADVKKLVRDAKKSTFRSPRSSPGTAPVAAC